MRSGRKQDFRHNRDQAKAHMAEAKDDRRSTAAVVGGLCDRGELGVGERGGKPIAAGAGEYEWKRIISGQRR
ncbi:hypothetical protein GCM10022269_03200 [Sphingorhabdus rigui]